MTNRVQNALSCARIGIMHGRLAFRALFRLMVSNNRMGMGPLLLTPDMIVRPGVRVIAHEVASRRCRDAYARGAVKRMRADPLWRNHA